MSTPCTQCHTELSPGAKFCLQCGTPAASPHVAPEAAPDAAWQPTGGPVAPPQPLVPDAPAPPVAGGWQPEGPPPAGPPSAQPPYVDGAPPQLNEPQFVETDGSSKGGGFGKLAGVGLGVIGIAAVGFLALRFIAGGDSLAGGASSPEDVVTEMVEAVNALDPLAAIALMAPDELDGLDDVIEDTADFYNDIGLDEVLDEQSEAQDLELDIDIRASRIDVSMEGENAAIVSFELSGDVEATGIDDLDMGETEFEFDSRDLEGALPNGSDEVEMIVVKLDGKWYASPMLTAGHYIVENADLPSGDYDQIGGDRDPGADSAEGAVAALVDVINDPDADALAAALGGGEGRVAVAFRDAIDEGFDEIDGSDPSYELTVETQDIGNGRVQFDEVVFDVENGDYELTIEDGCATVRDDGQRTERECIADALDVDDDDIDTTLWLDTVEEDGGYRVRIVPTITDVYGRFFDLFDDRQTLLFLAEFPQLDTPTEVSPGNDIDIEFDGQLYTVHEFEIEQGEAYFVSATNNTDIDLWVDDGFGLNRRFSDSFVAEEDGTARVVTYSEIDDEFDCTGLGCVPSGDGETTLRIRQAARQTVPFPTILSGELGPGDIRIFELEVTQAEIVTIEVDGATVDWRFVDEFDFSLGGGSYDLTPGTYELVVSNFSGDDPTSYTVTPSAN